MLSTKETKNPKGLRYKSYNITQNVSMLVCFEGCNRRVVIDPKKCTINKANKSFTYKALYKADNGNTYLVTATSLEGSNGLKASVKVYNRGGKKIIAERPAVDVRFGRKLFNPKGV